MTSETVAHFRLLQKLGEGGMGQVWLADDLRLARRVALKLLPDVIAADDRKKKAMLQEARAAAGLTHPNICVIYEASESAEGVPYISMEPIDGVSLRDHIGRDPVPLPELLSIGAQIADALAAAHEKSIIHRDVKPGNVIVTADRRVKVLDFGLAKFSPDADRPFDETAVLTGSGHIVGTVAYMSPEQALGHKLDRRSDIFSLGIVLYEMATGRRPFDGNSMGESIYRIVQAAPESIRKVNPNVSPRLEAIVTKCLAKEPANRYQNAADVARDLREIGVSGHSRGGTRTMAFAATGAAMLILLLGVVWQLTRSSRETAQTAPTAAVKEVASQDIVISSIAVLPFANLSADQENEYFSDGLTEELLNMLAQVKGLRVAARTSSFQFKGVNHDMREIGRKLNVETVLEGSVRKAGNRLRITAQLINAADGYHLWSKTYEREMEDVFAIQDDLSTTIVSSLMPRFAGGQGIELAKHPTENVQAYELYLQGRHQFWQGGGTEENLKRAAEFFSQAVEKDPKFALAWAGLSDAYMLQGGSGYLPPNEIFPQAKAAAERSLAADDRLAEGYVALASINWLYEWDWKAADENYRRSFSVNPLLHTRCICYVWYLAAVGNIDLAVVEAERARDMDPLARLPKVIATWMYYFAGRKSDVERQLADIFATDANDVTGRRVAAWSHWRDGRREEAVRQLQELREDFDKRGGFGAKASHIAVADLASMYARTGRRGEAMELLGELRERASRQYVAPENIGAVYAALGEMDEAMRWLDKAHVNRSNLGQFNVLPLAEPLRADPRYQQLIRGIGLPSGAG
jgi:TolB-like protein/tetratricopeptide (TPR) repeat protein